MTVNLGPCKVKLLTLTVEHDVEDPYNTGRSIKATFFSKRQQKEIELEDWLLDRIDNYNPDVLNKITAEYIQEYRDYQRDMRDLDWDFTHSKGVLSCGS